MLPRVLVVDDDYDMVETIRLFLESQGFPVVSAGDGAAALAAARETPPDICLVDLVLPDMDGLQLAKAIRGLPRCEHMPIIMLTAMGGSREVRSFTGKIADASVAHLEKPVDFRKLKGLIESLVSPEP